jgi:cytochrome c-type biogenesis protein CcsB
MNTFVFFDYQLVKYITFLVGFASLFYWKNLLLPHFLPILNVGKYLIFIPNFSLSILLVNRWITQNYFPLSNLYESLVFLTWSITLIHLILEKRTKSLLIGCIGSPIEFFLLLFCFFLPIELQKPSPLVPSLQSNWLMMHVSTMMISYSMLLVGSLLSLFYLVFSFYQKRSSNFIQPSVERSFENKGEKIVLSQGTSTFLQTIDIWSYRIIGIGFPCLTIGIISGAVWANEAWGSYWSWDPKETWALITWLVFATYLHTRLLKNWKNEKSSLIGSIGFFVIWVCYLGVNFLAKGLHTYGWIVN